MTDKERINIHHLISRQKKSTRWNSLNGIPLCPLHHRFHITHSPHKGGFPFYFWFIQNYSEKARALAYLASEKGQY